MFNPYSNNPFEILGADPAISTVEIQDIVRESLIDAETDEEKQVLRDAYNKITHPMDRLEHEIFCCPGIDLNRKLHQSFPILMTRLRGADLPTSFSLGLAAGLDAILHNQGIYQDIGSIVRGKKKHRYLFDEQAWNSILAERNLAPELIHCLAVLHHRWAFEFEETDQGEMASLHWLSALRYWTQLVRLSSFWEDLRSRLCNSSLWDEVMFSTYRDQFLADKIFSIHLDFARNFENNNQVERGAVHCALLRQVADEFELQGWQDAHLAVEGTLDKLASVYLNLAHDELNRTDGVEPGLRRRYRPAIEEAIRLLNLDPLNLRGLRFAVSEAFDWCWDLYVNERRVDMRTASKLVRSHADQLAELVAKNGGLLTDKINLSMFYMVVGYSLTDEKLAESTWDKAKAAYQRSLELDPGNRNAQDLFTEFPSTIAVFHIRKAVKARDQKKYEKAIQEAKKVPKWHSQYSQMKEFMASVYNAMCEQSISIQDFDTALKYAKQASRLSPDNEILDQNVKNIESASRMAQRAIAQPSLRASTTLPTQRPTPSDGYMASYYNRLCQQAVEHGDLDQALDYAKKALKEEPYNDVLKENLELLQTVIQSRQISPSYQRRRPQKKPKLTKGWAFIISLGAGILTWFLLGDIGYAFLAFMFVFLAIGQSKGWW